MNNRLAISLLTATFGCSFVASAMDCTSYGDRMFERQRLGEPVQMFLEDLSHGPKEITDLEHVADLLDSDYVFVNAKSSDVQRPVHDIASILKVPPLGNSPVDEFSTIELSSGPKMVPVNIFGLPGRAVSKTREGAFELERFSTLSNGEVKAFSILALRSGGGDVNESLRLMRSVVNFTDDQLHDYGIQFAIESKGECRTLSYARTQEGIGAVFSDGIGNFTSTADASNVVWYGATAQRKIWHKLRAKASGNVTVAVQPDLDNIGLVAVLGPDLMMISRTTDFDLKVDSFEKVGPNVLPFPEVARQCTELAGLKYYDEYEKRTDGRIPEFDDAVVGCMKNSNFNRVQSNRLGSVRLRLTLEDASHTMASYYIRKLNGDGPNRYRRYRAADLMALANACLTTSGQDIVGVITCMDHSGYELTRVDQIHRRQMFQIKRKEHQ